MFKEIQDYIENLSTGSISEDRKLILDPLIDFLQSTEPTDIIRLNFICTHNSRRSILSQVWAETVARHFGFRNIECYSGGTEATAIYPQIIKTFENIRFKVKRLAEGSNPIYAIKYADNENPIFGFSKVYDDFVNPSSNLIAMMTCNQADEACPFIPGTVYRVALDYMDPKVSDDTPAMEETYERRSNQIATEMKYIFSQLNKN
ncbi:protein-tyrosine-phosphatase [Flavobacteriaceae bacterium Ap0902]|nr:protein-tyrosine-phosphatase [Flavobacteriaceae bacterium Ap0902]